MPLRRRLGSIDHTRDPWEGVAPSNNVVKSCRRWYTHRPTFALLTASRDISMQQRHVHACRKIEAEARFRTTAVYCHLCFVWVMSDRWLPHCQAHLASLDDDCGPLSHCQLVLRPGFCPFCLGDVALDASARWKGWSTIELLSEHVTKNHHSNTSAWPQCCPHPNCFTRLDNFAGLADHFDQHHGLPEAAFFPTEKMLKDPTNH